MHVMRFCSEYEGSIPTVVILSLSVNEDDFDCISRWIDVCMEIIPTMNGG